MNEECKPWFRARFKIKVCPKGCEYPSSSGLMKVAFFPPEYIFCPFCGKGLESKEI